MIAHFPSCPPRNPKKPWTKEPHPTTDVPLEDGTGDVARVCNECGAHEIIKKATTP